MAENAAAFRQHRPGIVARYRERRCHACVASPLTDARLLPRSIGADGDANPLRGELRDLRATAAGGENAATFALGDGVQRAPLGERQARLVWHLLFKIAK